eukprot:106908-Pelagomonas_calceolata.AAC.4
MWQGCLSACTLQLRVQNQGCLDCPADLCPASCARAWVEGLYMEVYGIFNIHGRARDARERVHDVRNAKLGQKVTKPQSESIGKT